MPSSPPPATDMPEPEGDSAFSALLGLWNDLRGRLRRHGLSEPDADDCMQDTALRVLRAEQGSGSPSASPAFVRVVARSARIDWVRRQTVRRRVLGAPLDAVEHPTVAPRDGSTLDLAEALARLPAPFRVVVELSVREGLGYSDIAECLDIPLGTVKSRMSRALAILRRELGDG